MPIRVPSGREYEYLSADLRNEAWLLIKAILDEYARADLREKAPHIMHMKQARRGRNPWEER